MISEFNGINNSEIKFILTEFFFDTHRTFTIFFLNSTTFYILISTAVKRNYLEISCVLFRFQSLFFIKYNWKNALKPHSYVDIITAGIFGLKVILTIVFFRNFSFKIKSRKRLGPDFFTISVPGLASHISRKKSKKMK